jgi:hypothetical protein
MHVLFPSTFFNAGNFREIFFFSKNNFPRKNRISSPHIRIRRRDRSALGPEGADAEFLLGEAISSNARQDNAAGAGGVRTCLKSVFVFCYFTLNMIFNNAFFF